MKNFIKVMSLIGLMAAAGLAYSDPITDTYTKGDILTADTLNNIKSAVNQNDTRVNILESLTAGTNPDYSGYGVPFAADGATKNVVVLKRTNNDGSGSYSVRSRYANSVEQISIGGVMTTRPFIANYVFATFDTNEELTSLSNYIEAPLTTAYEDYVVEQSTYDVNTGAKTITDDTRSDLWVGTSVGAIQTGEVIVKVNGVQTGLDQYHDVRTLLGSGAIDSMSFSDLMGFQRLYNSSLSYRVRAKGIGDVLRLDDGSRVQKIIYYNGSGGTGGSLAGTPFDTGQLFDGVFF